MRRTDVLALLLVVVGCGGSTANEHGATDAGTDAAADASGEFCQGASKLELGGKLALDVPVTSSLTPVMNCCDAAVLRLHAKSALGSDFDLALRMMGAFAAGSYTLGTDTPLTATLRAPGGELWTNPNVTGSVVITQAGGDLPIQLALCLSVATPGDPLLGLRVWLDGVKIAPNAWQQRFGFWLLADLSLSAGDAEKLGLAALETEQYPALGLNEIGYYETSAHHVGWTPPLDAHEALLSKLGSVPVAGRPFVVEADGERIYLGAFVTLISSFAIDLPAVVVEQVGSDGFVIDGSYPSGSVSGPDPRNDPRILKVLGEAQKLVP